MTDDTNYCQVVFPAPELGDAMPCAVCKGRGVTHERMSTSWGHDPVTGHPRLMLAALFCPACGGCGRSGHDGCALEAHGYPSGALDELTDGPPKETAQVTPSPYQLPSRNPDAGPKCVACQDRHWHPMQGYRDDAPNIRFFAQMPCNCTPEDRIEPVPAEDIE